MICPILTHARPALEGQPISPAQERILEIQQKMLFELKQAQRH